MRRPTLLEFEFLALVLISGIAVAAGLASLLRLL